MNRSPHRKDWTNRPVVLVGPAVAYLILIAIFPLCYSLWLAFQAYDKATNTLHFVGGANFVELFTSRYFYSALKNSIILTAAAVTLELILGFFLASYFNQNIKGKRILRTLLILPMVTTPVITGLLWRNLFNVDWGMINYFLSLFSIPHISWLGEAVPGFITLIVADVWQWTPFVFLLVLAGLNSIPTELFEAAKVDGATAFQVLTRITIPVLKPALTIAFIFRAVDTFRVVDIVWSLTAGGPGISTRPLGYYLYQLGFTWSRLGYAAALGWVMVIIAVVGATMFFKLVKPELGVKA